VGRPPRYAVIATHNRPAELNALVEALAPQCDTIVIIDNASTPPVGIWVKYKDWPMIAVLRDPEQPPNLSRLWNEGLAEVESCAVARRQDVWDVAIFNDDAIVPPTWFDTVAAFLRGRDPMPAVCCTHTYGEPARPPLLKITPDGDLFNRMCPWAFVARGELGLRYNERLRWWWSDTLFDWAARRAGGVLSVPGPQVINSRANESTVGVLAEQAGKDRLMFEEITGGPAPW
jgi:glycosyltransferase involved in cell wall biosynthesis